MRTEQMRLFITAFFFLFFCYSTLNAQNNVKAPVIKFGDVKAEDFEPKSYSADTSASAVILADIGSSKFEGNKKGFFSVVYKQHRRIRIMNKNGFDEATVSITLYKDEKDEETLSGFEAVTYNLEAGKVVATKLDKSSIFQDKVNKNYTTRKFTFPNLKEGSIIEFQYKITSDRNPPHIRAWNFQGSLPRIWSQYEVTCPALFDYAMYQQGLREFDLRETKNTRGSFSMTYNASRNETSNDLIGQNRETTTVDWSGDISYNVWGMQNVAPLKEEPYMSSTDNYIQRIEFQLKTFQYNDILEKFLNDWKDLSERLLKNEDFGAQLAKDNSFLNEEIGKVVSGAANQYEKAKRIYEYVRDNYKCNHNNNDIWMTQPLKETFKNKSGNVADINLLLTAIYKNQGFDAEPVILSTKENGRAFESYPLLGDYNYVITRLKIGAEIIFADASYNYLGFGRLDKDSYNGSCRVIKKKEVETPIILSPDSLKESSVTSVFLINDEKTKQIMGTFKSNPGYYKSLALREKVNKSSLADYIKDIKKSYGFDVKVNDASIDSLGILENPVALNYSLSFAPEGSILYFNPMLSEGKKENPFKSATRAYPVEMPYQMDETYLLSMEIPKGYKVDELPQSVRVRLNEDGIFEYIIEATATTIQLRSRIVISRATFINEDYSTLREFFARIVKKHSEQIVLKKS
jgi:hypothetical protein